VEGVLPREVGGKEKKRGGRDLTFHLSMCEGRAKTFISDTRFRGGRKNTHLLVTRKDGREVSLCNSGNREKRGTSRRNFHRIGKKGGAKGSFMLSVWRKGFDR